MRADAQQPVVTQLRVVIAAPPPPVPVPVAQVSAAPSVRLARPRWKGQNLRLSLRLRAPRTARFRWTVGGYLYAHGRVRGSTRMRGALHRSMLPRRHRRHGVTVFVLRSADGHLLLRRTRRY